MELASGLHAYLQERCNSSVAWEATGGNQLDTRCLQATALAAAADARPLYRGRSVPYHYYQNAVTPRHGCLHARQGCCAPTCQLFPRLPVRDSQLERHVQLCCMRVWQVRLAAGAGSVYPAEGTCQIYER